jgi:hypothetical protein
VFHVSQLKLKLEFTAIALPKLPPVNAKGVLQLEPVEVLGRCSRPKDNRPLIKILVRWEGQPADDAIWEEFPLSEGCLTTPCGQGVMIGEVLSQARNGARVKMRFREWKNREKGRWSGSELFGEVRGSWRSEG